MIQHATDDDFDDVVLSASSVVLVEFWATWCGPCKAIEPHLKRLSKTYADRVTVVKVNIADAPDMVHTYNVQGVPTFMFVDGEQIVWQHAGSVPPHRLRELIMEYT